MIVSESIMIHISCTHRCRSETCPPLVPSSQSAVYSLQLCVLLRSSYANSAHVVGLVAHAVAIEAAYLAAYLNA